MNWTQTVFEVIDMRSFSNLWFWIALAVMWSTASYWVLGVPFDMIQRATRGDEEAMGDVQHLVHINVKRILFITGQSGLWLIGFLCFFLTGLIVLGFVYRVEFAQALFLLGFPIMVVSGFAVRLAYIVNTEGYDPDTLIRRLIRHRTLTQFIGMFSIFVTATYGMFQNIGGGNGF